MSRGPPGQLSLTLIRIFFEGGDVSYFLQTNPLGHGVLIFTAASQKLTSVPCDAEDREGPIKKQKKEASKINELYVGMKRRIEMKR